MSDNDKPTEMEKIRDLLQDVIYTTSIYARENNSDNEDAAVTDSNALLAAIQTLITRAETAESEATASYGRGRTTMREEAIRKIEAERENISPDYSTDVRGLMRIIFGLSISIVGSIDNDKHTPMDTAP